MCNKCKERCDRCRRFKRKCDCDRCRRAHNDERHDGCDCKGKVIMACLNGNQEVPPVSTQMKGTVKFVVKHGKIHYKLTVKNNTGTIVAAHIHCALPGINGPVGVTLFSGSFSSPCGTLAKGVITAPDNQNGCGWNNVSDIVRAMKDSEAYVNVHTTAYPSGEIRGNLTLC